MSTTVEPTGFRVGERNAVVLRLTRIAARLLLAPFFHLQTGGRENLPTGSAFVLLPKHQRWEDIPLLALATPRPLYYMAKHELFVHPLCGRILSGLGGIPLNRRRPLESRRSLRAMIEFLGKGEGIVVFPEGTYFQDRMGPGHVGLIRLVCSRLSLPFIPVGIRYGRGRWRRKVWILYGRPIYADAASPAADLLDRSIKEIARLSGMENRPAS